MTTVTAFGPGRKESGGALFSTFTPLGHWNIEYETHP